MLLSSCAPGLVLNLYNATGDTLRITNSPFRRVVTIAPNTATDVPISADVLVRTVHGTWTYSPGSLVPPTSLFQQHGMLWRAFGKIDRHGYVYIRVATGAAQPTGFPVKPKQT